MLPKTVRNNYKTNLANQCRVDYKKKKIEIKLLCGNKGKIMDTN